MLTILILLFLVLFLLSLFEKNMGEYNKFVYVGLALLLITMATVREIGFDNDSEQYEYLFKNYEDPYVALSVEPSFLLLSSIINTFTDDVHVLFFFYALIGISLKMFAIKRLSEFWFLPLLIYLGNFYVLHDLTQIRAGVVSGLFLLALTPMLEGRKKRVALILLLCCLFHYSSIALFPVLFLSNKDLDSPKMRWLWAAVVPVGYVFAMVQTDFLSVSIPYIGEKIETYQELRDKGVKGSEINIFNAVFLVKCVAYEYSLFFYDRIKSFNVYATLLIKLMGVSIFSFLFFSFLPVLAFRVSELYGIVEIIFFANLYYTIKPFWAATTVVLLVGVGMFCINAFYAEFLHP